MVKNRQKIEDLIQKHFNTKSFSSFRRQLSYYGFSITKKTKKRSTFYNANFKKGKSKATRLIQRIVKESKQDKAEVRRAEMLKKALDLKEKQVYQFEDSIIQIKEANKTLKRKLDGVRAHLIDNIRYAVKFAAFIYLVCDEQKFVQIVNKFHDTIFKGLEIDPNKTIAYKDIQINLDALLDIIKFSAQAEILCGKRLKTALSTMNIPSNPFLDALNECLSDKIEKMFLNKNVNQFDETTVLEHYYDFYCLTKQHEIKSKTRSFKVMFPDLAQENKDSSVNAVYNSSENHLITEQSLFSDNSSVNSFKLFFQPNYK